MLKLTKITYSFLFLLLLSPILSYLTFVYTELPVTYYFQLFTCFYGLIFFTVKWKSIKMDMIHYFFICYILYLIIWSFFNGIYETNGLFNNANAANLSILFILIIVYNTHFSDRFIRNSLLIFKITVILAVSASVIQVLYPNFLKPELYKELDATTISMYQFRRVSIFGYLNQNEIGLSFMPLLALLVGVLLYYKKKSYIIFLILGGITAFLTNTRYVMVAFIIITLQIVVFQKSRVKGLVKYLIFAGLIIMILYYLFIYFGYNFSDWYNERLFSEGSFKETTRYKAWENFLIFFPQAMFFGTGGEGFTREMSIAIYEAGSSEIHVGYLSHLIFYGIIGSFFLFGFWFLLIRKLYFSARETKFWGSLFAFSIFLWAQVTMSLFSIFFYGLIFAFVFDKYFRDKKLEAENIRIASNLK